MKPHTQERRKSASNIIQFPVKNSKSTWIPLPSNARFSDCFDEYICFNDCLEDLGIYDGYKLTCRTSFELSEIKSKTLCIVLFLETNEQTAKLVTIDRKNQTVTLYGASKHFQPITLFDNEIQILAIVEEVRRPIKGGKIL